MAGKDKYIQIFFLAKSRLVVCISISCVAKACEAYEEFFVNYGAPTRIIADKHQAENKGKKVMALLLKYQVERGFTVAGQQWQNRAERFVGFLKDRGQYMSSKMNIDPQYRNCLF